MLFGRPLVTIWLAQISSRFEGLELNRVLGRVFLATKEINPPSVRYADAKMEDLMLLSTYRMLGVSDK